MQQRDGVGGNSGGRGGGLEIETAAGILMASIFAFFILTYTVFLQVGRWQNLIPSFPWIAPGWRAWGGQSKERKGSNFAA